MPPTTSLKAVLRHAPDLVDRNVAGEKLLVPISGDLADMQNVYTLNPVAGFVWEKIDGALDLEAVSVLVCEEFDVDRETARADVLEFATGLLEAGLAERASGT